MSQNRSSVPVDECFNTWELSVNRIDLQAPTLAGPPQTNLGAGTPSCTTNRQLTMHVLVM